MDEPAVREGYLADSTDPDPDDFVPNATMPTLDYREFQSRVVYPEAARRNGIEGRVAVMALVDEHGTVRRYRIDQYDDKLLVDAAVDAVLATTFTPGKIGDELAPIWVGVPVVFKLK